MSRVKGKKKRSKSLADHTSKMDKDNKVDQLNIKDDSGEHEENHAAKKVRNKKRKNTQTAEGDAVKGDEIYEETERGFAEENTEAIDVQENKRRKSVKKKSKKEKKAQSKKEDTESNDNSEQQNDDRRIQTSTSVTQCEVENCEELCRTDFRTSSGTRKSKKAQRKKGSISSKGDEKFSQKKRDVEEDEVYQISSGDEDCLKGMNKWIMEYHQLRPGLKVLQERIDEFIVAHEACEEQERKEREALAAEDGWTVVTHHRGRKKTTDVETGVAVGSVTQSAVLNKMAKKKSKGVGLDFYRFQKREARRNEIMVLQSKFEQDKKKIQQLRAARKFRPY